MIAQTIYINIEVGNKTWQLGMGFGKKFHFCFSHSKCRIISIVMATIGKKRWRPSARKMDQRIQARTEPAAVERQTRITMANESQDKLPDQSNGRSIFLLISIPGPSRRTRYIERPLTRNVDVRTNAICDSCFPTVRFLQRKLLRFQQAFIHLHRYALLKEVN